MEKKMGQYQNVQIMQVLSQVFRVVLQHHLNPDPEKKPLSIHLNASGISDALVKKSLNWLQKFFTYNAAVYEPLAQAQTQSPVAQRVYAPQELQRIGLEGQHFLTTLTLQHVLSPAKREFLLDCILSEDIAPLTLRELQFLTFMVISQDCTRPGEVQWLAEIVLKPLGDLNTLAPSFS